MFFITGFSISSNGQLIDVSSDLGLITDHTGGFLGTGVSFVDFNSDGYDDLSFGHHAGELKFFQGDGSTLVVVDLGIDNQGAESKGIIWADFDNDGDQDLFVTNRLASNRVWRNDNSVFIDISSTCGISQSIESRSYGMSFADYDNDGFLDFYICNYHTWIDDVENELYRNNGDGTFSETTIIAGVGNGLQQSFQSSWIDINNDGWMDLHVINDRLDMPNAFYINNGDGTFIDMAEYMGVDLGIYAMSSTFSDFDRDGDMDLYVTNGMQGNVLLLNSLDEYGEFYDVTNSSMTSVNNLCWAANWIDYDNNGWDDLYVTTGFAVYTDYPAVLDDYPESLDILFTYDGMFPFINSGTTMPQTEIHSFAVAQGDFNQDGFPDLISHKVGNKALMLKGVPNDNHWAKVLLQGTTTNINGVGCEIKLTCDIQTSGLLENMKVVFAGENYLGQNSYWQHFGLGIATEIETISVTWMGGVTETFGPFDVDQSIILVEGSSGNPQDPTSTLGCMYMKACNYNEDATEDDGSCDMSCLCGDGTVWDILTGNCIGYIPCPSDVNQNGATEVGDLLIILTEYGASCEE